MRWPWQTSDSEFIDRIRRVAQVRRRIGVGLLVLSLVIWCAVGYFLHVLQTGDLPVSDDSVAQGSFQIGAMTGFVGGLLLFAAINKLLVGLYMYFPDRRERLLLAYHQRLAELDELPLESSDAIR